jgi:hypothetical protein
MVCPTLCWAQAKAYATHHCFRLLGKITATYGTTALTLAT